MFFGNVNSFGTNLYFQNYSIFSSSAYFASGSKALLQQNCN